MNSKRVFALLAFLFPIMTYVLYVQAILSGGAHPTISSWISWGVMDFAILSAMIAARSIAWQMVAYTIGTAVIIGVSLLKGVTVGWSNLDSVCIVVVIVAIILWIISGKPSVAVIFSIVAAVIGSVPNIVNVWHNPTNEPLLPWLLITVGSVFGVAAIKKWDTVGALTPIAFLVLQVAFVLLISFQFF